MEQVDSGLSLENQRSKIEAQAVISDWTLRDIIEDAGQSAKNLERPGAREVRAQVKAGLVDAIIIYKLDRLTRSVKDMGVLLEELGKARRADGGRGVDLVSVSENIDTSTATGRLLVNILGSVSQWEREVIAERTSAALQQRKSNGYVSGGVARFGYQAGEDRREIPNEGEQAQLQEILRLREEGLSFQRIADSLNEVGYRTRRGGPHSKQGIHRIAQTVGIR